MGIGLLLGYKHYKARKSSQAIKAAKKGNFDSKWAGIFERILDDSIDRLNKDTKMPIAIYSMLSQRFNNINRAFSAYQQVQK